MKRITIFFLVSVITFSFNASHHFDPAVQLDPAMSQVSHITKVLTASRLSEEQQSILLQRLDIKLHDSKKSPKEIVDDVVSAEFPGLAAFTLELKAACRIYVAAQRIKSDNSAK